MQAEPQKINKDSVQESRSANKAETHFAEAQAAVAEVLGLDLAADQTLVPRREDYGAGRDLHRLFKALCDLDDTDVLKVLTFITAECLPADSAMV